MAEIKRSTRAPFVRSEIARLTGKQNWNSLDWWREFLEARRNFLSDIKISAKPKQTELTEVEAAFKNWVRGSTEWWGGNWVDESGLAKWHVSQYLRARAEPVSAEPDNGQAGQSSAGAATRYYDPTRDQYQ